MRKNQNPILERALSDKKWNRIAVTVVLPLLVVVVVLSVILVAQLASTDGNAAICGYEEHTHTEECYALEQICGLAESEPHLHILDCYEPLFICEDDDETHTHGSECYASALICDLDLSLKENEEHIHEEGCYTGVPVCKFSWQTPHTHGEGCLQQSLLCEQPEHVHAEECYPIETTTEPTVGDDANSGISSDTEPPEPTPASCPLCGTNIPHGHTDADKESTFMGFAPALGMIDGIPYNADLFNFVTGVVIRDSEGHIINTGEFLYGETYTFSITFKEESAKQFEYHSDGFLHYSLPPQIAVVFPVTNAEILLPNGKVAGHYNIDTVGNVTVSFDNVDNQGNLIGVNFIDRYQNVTFLLDIDMKFAQGVSVGQILFGPGSSVTINSIKDPDPGLKVDKTASAFDRNAETVHFAVRITAVGSPINSITLNDTLHIRGNNIPSGGLNIQSPFLAAVAFKYQINGAGPEIDIIPTWIGDTMRFNFDSLVLPKDHYITLKYTLPLSAALDFFGAQINGSNPWIQRLMYNLTLTNTAVADGRDGLDTAVPSVPGITTSRLQKTFLGKTAKASVSSNTITWTATAGDGSLSLNNRQLTDTLGNTPAHSIVGNITVKLYGSPNASGVFENPETVVISAPTYSGLTAFSADGGFAYTVPNGYGGISDMRRVEFVYTTEPSTPSLANFTNELSLTLNGNTSTARRTVSFDVGFACVKSSRFIGPAGAPTGIAYTIVLTIPEGRDGNEIIFNDFIGARTPGVWNHYFCPTLNNLSVTIDPPEPDFVYRTDVRCSSIVPYLYFSFGFDGDWDNIKFDGTNDLSVEKWAYEEAKTVTITYEISLDEWVSWKQKPSSTPYWDFSNWEPDKSKGTLRDWLAKEMGNAIWNVAQLSERSDGMPSAQVATSSAVDTLPIHKTVAANASEPDVFDYKVYLNSGAVMGTSQVIFLSDNPAIFADTFDPRLEYVSKSFYIKAVQSLTGTIDSPYGYGPYTGSSGTLVSSALEDSALITVGDGFISLDISQLNRFSWPTGGEPKDSSSVQSATMVSSVANFYSNPYVYEIGYQLRVKEEYLLDSFTVGNIATVYTTTESYGYNTPWSAGNTVEYGGGVIRKNGVIDGGMVDVEIIINPMGDDLVPDPLPPLTVDKTRFTAMDQMSGGLSFFLSSVAFYTQGGSVGAWDGIWNTTPETISTIPGAIWSIEYIDAQNVNFVLPNETPVRIVYVAQITVPPGMPVAFKNTVSVFAHSDYFQEDHHIVQDTGINSLYGEDFPLQLYKEDAETDARLPGAAFALYVATKTAGGIPDGFTVSDPYIAIGGRHFYYLTNSDEKGGGLYEFVDQKGSLYVGNDAIFMLVETAAPTNYNLPEAPYNRTFFVLSAIDVTEQLNLETALGRPVRLIADNITISNLRKSDSVTISGNKIVYGDIASSCSFTFYLRELNPPDYAVANLPTIGDFKDGGVALTAHVNNVTAPGIYTFAFPEIEELDDGVYWYQVWETDNAAERWTYDLAPRIVKVTVVGGVAAVTDITGGASILGGSSVSWYTISHAPAFYFDSSIQYEYLDKPGGSIWRLIQPLGGNGSLIYHVLCAERDKSAPEIGHVLQPYAHVRDHSTSALAYALASTDFGAELSHPEVFELFDFTASPSLLFGGNDTENRQDLMADALRYYEATVRYPSYNWDPTNASVWPNNTTTPAGRIGRGLIQHWGSDIHYLYEAIGTINAMMDAYNGSSIPNGTPIARLVSDYTPDALTPNAGVLQFSYIGYQPPVHELTLYWTGSATVMVGGSAYTNGSAGISVASDAMIEISDADDGVIFTATDSMNYLIKGSIVGHLLVDIDVSNTGVYQDLLIGSAAFANLHNRLPVDGNELNFINLYKKPFIPPPESYGIEFPATGDKGIRIFLGIGTTILVLSIGGTLIYKKQKRG
ncbi:MAG: hypothetical protein FWF13_04375, partial [Acidobacteria bacterium]|nr:hypothetical protein [Acidobacteriota bacterium]